ncbi:MAG: hypothetical protein GX939_04855 [Clostridiaceae bacterium]|jgi:hypothetical protein|nr:hypothetical protein [Clostridiaceae bacterium]
MKYSEICQMIESVWEGDPDEFKLTDSDLDDLITCEKNIVNKVKNPRFEENVGQRFFKLDLVASKDSSVAFLFHIRINKEMPLNFSVVLTLPLPTKNLTLFRCNGPHNEPDDRDPLHSSYHTHTVTTNDIQAKIFNEPKQKLPANYSSILGAIRHFAQHCNIVDLVHALPQELGNIKQISIGDIKNDQQFN